ncbi:MAG: choice-of-anchor Q domain-containing protein, partial [Pirellulaceae bacterium]|nr:choice-of-anchor Q domain-containing protein [Pirellulaceae bacterium]
MVAILAPANQSVFNGLSPIDFTVFGRSEPEPIGFGFTIPRGVDRIRVTANAQTIADLNFGNPIEATASFSWTPPSPGDYTLDAIMTNGLNQQIVDPVNTIITVVSPRLSISKSVTPDADLFDGDSMNYTITVTNDGNGDAENVNITDTLPAGVGGSNLDTTVIVAAGESQVFNIPAVMAHGNQSATITNTAAFSHSSGAGTADATLVACENLVVTNSIDGGPGSLRQAIEDACNGAIIAFDDSHYIQVSSSLFIDKELTIDGSGHDVYVSGGSRSQIFNIGPNGDVELNKLTLFLGYATQGGGIFNDGQLTLDGVTVRNGTASGASGEGGGLHNTANGSVTISNSTFNNNWSDALGGAIFNAGSLTTFNTTVSGNTADDGAGIYNSSGMTNASHITVSGNRARGPGGGVMALDSGKILLANSIVANNNGDDCNAPLFLSVNNIIDDGTCGAALNVDPRIGPLRNNGGPTQTHALLFNSPAIN